MRVPLLVMSVGGLVLAGATPRGQATLAPQGHELRSPDGRTVVAVTAFGGLRWSVTRDGVPLVLPSAAGLTIDGRVLGRGDVLEVARRRADERVASVFYARRRVVRDRFEESTLTLDDGLRFVVRASCRKARGPPRSGRTVRTRRATGRTGSASSARSPHATASTCGWRPAAGGWRGSGGDGPSGAALCSALSVVAGRMLP